MYNYSNTNNSFLANIPNQLMQIENIMGTNGTTQVPNKINNVPNTTLPINYPMNNYNNSSMNIQSKFS